jgi:hypothetical protein
MLQVEPTFKSTMQSPIKRVSGYIVLQDGTEIRDNGDLQSYTITSTGNFLKTAMSELKATFLGQQEALKGSMIDAYFGTFYEGEWHYVLKGKFNVTDAKYSKDSDMTELTGYDNMIQFAVPYFTVGSYPTTLLGYLTAVCAGAGVDLQSESIYNGALTVSEDLYKNVEEFTFRDVLEDICEVSASYALINANGELELRQLEDTAEVLTYDNLIEYSTGDRWGGVNSLVLSRQPQNDDIYVQDEEDIRRPTNRNIFDLSKFNVTYSAEES